MKWNGNFWLILFSLWFVIGCDHGRNQFPETANYNIIPQPQNLEGLKGFFQLNEDVQIYSQKSCLNEAKIFQEFLQKETGLLLSISEDVSDKNTIFINLTEKSSPESYSVEVSKKKINLSAHTALGVSRGIATLKQLLLLNSDSINYFIPNVKIQDSPKFKHRGLLLDCSRHFFDKEVVKKYIDLLAFYKMNVLHWHLTEDQGWRIAIDKYPKLTEIGAWRKEEDGSKYGGFYTKEEIKEIVTYAQQRHITVIPEIELPGHSQAAIAAYPHLSCTGNQVEVANDWGVFKEIYCAGNDSVFTFLEDVLTEVIELFPSEYIHIGGDEAPKFRWEHCVKCQQRMKNEGLKDEHGLQSYFISRVEQFLNRNGRQLIGWDEILEGGLSPNATVQSWRGMEGGITAAESGHNAIMSPTSHAYLDYDLKAIDLEKVYNFDPIPSELAKDKHHFIIGGEVNMWTEHVPDENNLDSKVFPRILAMSEVLWSYPKERNYEHFYDRVQHHYPMLKNMNVNYGAENLPIQVETMISDSQVYIMASPGNKDLTVHYKWECDTCTQQVFEWAHHEIMLQHSGELTFQAFKHNQKYGDPIKQSVEFHQGLTKKVKYSTNYNQWYTAGGDSGLVDGKIGSLDFRDGNWQGFWGDDAEIVIDLGEEKEISSIYTNYYQYNNSWIFIPTSVQYAVSKDGERYINFEQQTPQKLPSERGKFIEQFALDFNPIKVRYIKVKATNIKTVPEWHEAAGSDAWVFIDEIIVK